MGSGQTWWADHEETLEHIQGKCSCTEEFRKSSFMPPALPEAADLIYDTIDGRPKIVDRSGRTLKRL